MEGGGEGGEKRKKRRTHSVSKYLEWIHRSRLTVVRRDEWNEDGYPLFDFSSRSIDRSIDRIFPLVFFTFFFFFFFPSFITRTKGKDKKSTRVPLMYAHTSPHPYTHVSASRLSPTTLRFTKLVAFLPPPPLVEIYRCLWSNKFPLEAGKSGAVAAASGPPLDLSNTETAEPGRPAAPFREKENADISP